MATVIPHLTPRHIQAQNLILDYLKAGNCNTTEAIAKHRGKDAGASRKVLQAMQIRGLIKKGDSGWEVVE